MVDLFRYRFIFVPIHDYLHWSLAIICNPGSCARPGEPHAPLILHLDSLEGAPACQDTDCHIQQRAAGLPALCWLPGTFFQAGHPRGSRAETGMVDIISLMDAFILDAVGRLHLFVDPFYVLCIREHLIIRNKSLMTLFYSSVTAKVPCSSIEAPTLFRDRFVQVSSHPGMFMLQASRPGNSLPQISRSQHMPLPDLKTIFLFKTEKFIWHLQIPRTPAC